MPLEEEHGFDKGVIERKIIVPDEIFKKNKKRKSIGKKAKRKIAERKIIDSFVLEDFSNPKLVQMFYELYLEDIREVAKKGRPLTREEKK